MEPLRLDDLPAQALLVDPAPIICGFPSPGVTCPENRT
jgi:hypothetical protein